MEKLDDSKMGAVPGHLIVHLQAFYAEGPRVTGVLNWKWQMKMIRFF